MLKRTKIALMFILLVSFYTSHSFALVEFFQNSKINSNGSIKIEITYKAKETDVKSKNNIIGGLPFTVALLNEYFAIPGGKITKAIVYKDPGNKSLTNSTIEFEVTDINQISKCKALNSIKVSWFKKDGGMAFSWLIPITFMNENFIDTYQFVLKSDLEMISTNGLKADSSASWFVYANKMDPAGAYFTANVKEVTSQNISTGDKKNKQPENSCGLFGFELPIIVLFGIALSFRKKIG